MSEPTVLFDRMPAEGPSGTLWAFTRPGFDRDVSFVVDSDAPFGPGRVNNDLGIRRGFAMSRWPQITVEERFWTKVDRSPGLGPTGECWEWRGYRRHKNYGEFRASTERGVLAHRFAYELTYGPIPEGQAVCHRCDNPPCCKPAHLFLGTLAQNNRDMWNKGRGKFGPGPRGETHHSSKLSDADVREIRRRFAAGETKMALARSFGVAHNAIRMALLGKRGLL